MAEEHSDTVNKLSDINSEITKILDKYDKEKTDRMSSDDDMALSKLIERAEQQPVTRDILKACGIAKTVNSIAQYKGVDNDVRMISQHVIDRWKKAVERERKTSAGFTSVPPPTELASPITTISSPPAPETKPEIKASPQIPDKSCAFTEHAKSAEIKSDIVMYMIDCEKAMFETHWHASPKAGARPSSPQDGTFDGLNMASLKLLPLNPVESGIATPVNYRNQFKVLVLNLRNPLNEEIRRRIIDNEITPSALACATVEDMCSKVIRDKKREIYEFEKEKIKPDWKNKTAASDFYKCPRCKQRNCTFYQKQTRSADEPMTSFIHCMNCDHQWRDGN